MEIGVLFCDQVGSTALLTRLGDALADEVRRDLFEVLHQAAERCRGEVIKGSGDGLMVVFPSGSADALRCGELMVTKVHRLARRELWSEVALKVGVSYGEAIFDRDDWYGAAVNLAARLCAAAASGQVLASAAAIDAAMVDAAGWDPLPAMSLKGFPDPVPVKGSRIDSSDQPQWPVVVEFDVAGAAALVGREAELDQLETAFHAASAGPSGVVTVAGPPGAGVSRLLGEFAGRVGGSCAVLSARVDAGAGWAAQLVRSHAATARRQDLQADAGADAAALTAICPLLGLRLEVVPQSDGHESAEALLFRLLARICQRVPVLVVLDGQTLDAEVWQALPPRTLVVAAGRMEPGTAQREHTLVLEPFTADEVHAMLNAALPTERSWRAALDALVTVETDGVPRDVVAVVDELRRESSSRDPRPAAAFDAVRRAVPYKGLQVFADDDAVRFHGRERAVDDVMAALDERRFVAVVGSSGSGKSSVVRAGCLPRISARGSELIVVAPGEDPLRTLAVAWCRASGGDPEALHERLQMDPTALERLRPPGAGTVLVIDQLEECFTLCTDEQVRDQYLRTITHQTSDLRVLTTLRGDFFGRASEHPELAESLRSGTVLMTPPTRAELREMIEAPARAAHLRLAAGLTDLVLADVTERPGSLPLLSHALRETWRRRRANTLSIDGYRVAGGATGAIARTADSVFDQLSDSERDIAKRIFLRLTALGEGVEDARRRVPTEVLLAGASDASQRVLHTLTAARLITADTDAEGRDIDELAHEALLREWPRLREWLDEDREELRALAHLETAARDWDGAERPESELYTGRRLDGVEGVSPDKLNDRERAFLMASLDLRVARRRQARRSRRRLQTFAAVLVVLLLLATGAGVIAINKSNDAQAKTREARAQTQQAQQQARIATARDLATQAQSQLATQPAVAMLLAAEAVKLQDSPQNRATLLTTVSSSPHLARIAQGFGQKLANPLGYSGPLASRFSLSPDSRVAAVVGDGGSLRLWDFLTQKPLTPEIKVDRSAVVNVSWSSTGTLAVAWADGAIRLFSGSSGRQLLDAPIHLPKPQQTAVSPDGTILVAKDASGILHRWSLPDGRALGSPLDLHLGAIDSLLFRPDGERLVVGDVASGTVHVVDPVRGTETTSFSLQAYLPDGIPADIVGYSPNGRSLLVVPAYTIGPLTINAVTGKKERAFSFPQGVPGLAGEATGAGIAVGAAFSPDGRYVARIDQDGTIVVWRTADGADLDNSVDGSSGGANGRIHFGFSQSGQPISLLAFTPDGTHFVTGDDHEIFTWAINGNAALPGSGQETSPAEGASFALGAVGPRHTFIAADGAGHAGVWNTDTGRRIASGIKIPADLSALTADPVSGALAVIAGQAAQVDLIGPGPAYAMAGRLTVTGYPEGVAYSPVGSRLAVVSSRLGPPSATSGGAPSVADGYLTVFDLSKPGHPSFSLKVDTAGARSVRWSVDGKKILVGGDPDVVTVDASTHVITRRAPVPSFQINGVGSDILGEGFVETDSTYAGTFLAGSQTGRVTFYNQQGGAKLPSLVAPAPVLAAAISPDGKLLETFGADGVALWQLPTGKRLASGLKLQGLSAFLDDDRLIDAEPYETATLIDLSPAALIRSACTIAARNLSKQEFADYLGSASYHPTCAQWPAGS